jgi:ABC-2 type transport system permease protein
MARHDPLLPNALIVARREYRDRTRSPLFVASTIVLMILAVGVAMTPITMSYLDRGTQTGIDVVAADPELSQRAVTVLESVLNAQPADADPDEWQPPFRIQAATIQDAEARLDADRIDGILVVDRLDSGQLTAVYRTIGVPDAERTQLVSIAAFGLGVLDWSARLPDEAFVDPFQNPQFDIEPVGASGEGGTALDARELASRTFLGTVFIVLMFISILIYGMWVATGVATEKSSRVMELMISAASPRQLVLGKVAGIGGAGLTQYLAVALPALVVLAFQDRLAAAILGPAGVSGVPTGALTPALLLAYGVFFILGFTLFAFVYAAVGSYVSRPDDLQTLSLPLSLIAMTGYLVALPILLSGGGGPLSRLASLIPPFSPFAMLARVMTGTVPAWELALSIGLLVVFVVVVAGIAIRIYAAGVLLYGQRPGIRAFVSAARRASSS